MILKKVELYIEKNKLLFPEKGKILVGVSGGRDSVALLDILIKLGYRCTVAHCNFHLRGEESDRDEKFVQQLSFNLNIPYYSVDFDTVNYAKQKNISIEMAARELRYSWFTSLAEKINAQAIAIAHHADDNVETLLMHLVRGTGLKGLTGISPKNGLIVRPLLCCTRNEINEYIKNNNLSFIEDSTNQSVDFQRNKIRLQVIPLLEEINPSVKKVLSESIERFSEINTFYENAIEKIKKQLLTVDNDQLKINIDLLCKQASPKTILFEILHPYGFNESIVQDIEKHLHDESGKIFYSPTHYLIKDRKYLIISNKIKKNETTFFITENDSEISFPIQLSITRKKKEQNFVISKDNRIIQIDASLIQYPLTLRRWTNGDTFFPFGMNRQKKLSDFFIDQKLNLKQKAETWLLLSQNQIVWVVGLRLDNRFKITESTQEVLEIKML
ncbi:MAG: tRNA lysidine(34) synthetase TilS [Paludibacteraceae bacterium]|nr:tRNA lysidine(34) synthetase TilS [Paludibacteraceae bacterium]OPZ02037.1 MAG: tRNA(Ile)-lysidine synthase [Bacteroidetes bacterium ADurb.BinA395]HOF98326.1 tRNA lysidine(34) synthetase TilS [Paludibacteraceae bacterium]HOR38987.1 tRNA lysidine(34) synthetase TilS [Paludibacteraceae bacterium]HPL76014.1 tRNA lysidine(34) synthetase TilS [Paludibacteraceae bacterium]